MRTSLIALALLAVTATVAAAGPKDPTKRHTAADMRLARSIALELSDLQPGWKQEKTSSDSGADCSAQPDESKLIETGSVDPTFDSPNGGAVTVDSEVDVYKTKAMALADWRTAKLADLRACLAELLAKEIGKRPTVTGAKASVPVRAERTLGFHFEMKAKGVVITADLIGIGKGRTTVLLTALGVKGSYHRSALTPLARLLAQRLARA